MDTINAIIDELKEQYLDTLSRWIAVPSVKADAADGAPFGAEVARMLDVALKDCADMGFAVRNIDHYAGDARMGPVGVDPLGILANLDVVPVGDGWLTDPFAATRQGDRIAGRGTSDDKGPALAALFAMLAIQKAGIPLRREVRLILGCDEESGWADIDYYVAHCDMPKVGFSPDSNFPVINTEKGGLNLTLRAPAATDGLRVRKIAVGERVNVIPGKASAVIEGDAAFCEHVNQLAKQMTLDVDATDNGDGTLTLHAAGIPGHAAYPESARNANGILLLMLRALGVTGGLRALADRVGVEYDGGSMNIACSDATSGALTCNLGILRYDENGLYATLDIRYPLLANPDAIVEALTAALKPELDVTLDHSRVPHHVAPSSPLVTALLDAYHDVTGRPKECIATGGGTYARCLEEGVAFGCAFPEEEDVAHQANESIDLNRMIECIRIFAYAIVKLAGASVE